MRKEKEEKKKDKDNNMCDNNKFLKKTVFKFQNKFHTQNNFKNKIFW